MRRGRRYLAGMGTVVVLLLGALAAMNVAMDPLGYARVAGWRPAHPDAVQSAFQSSGAWPVPHGTRDAKILNVGLYAPTTVYFGSSTVWSYVDAGYKPILWDDRKAYNFGLAGANAHEIAEAFAHVVALHPPRRAIVGLEFYMFSADKPTAPGYEELPFAQRPSYRLDFWRFIGQHVFSAEYTSASAAEVWKSISKWTSAWLSPTVSAATIDRSQPRTRAEFDAMMLSIDKVQVVSLYPADRSFRTVDDAGVSTLDAIRRIVALARQHDIDLRLYLSPNHARSFETIRLLGWWPQFEAWQRELAAIVSEDAKAHPGDRPVELWDFCCYNGITTDVIADLSDGAGFEHFADTIHFKTPVGYMLMDRMFGTEAAASLPADFGIRVTADTVDSHLAEVRDAQRAYVSTHPGDVQAITDALKAVGRLKAQR